MQFNQIRIGKLLKLYLIPDQFGIQDSKLANHERHPGPSWVDMYDWQTSMPSLPISSIKLNVCSLSLISLLLSSVIQCIFSFTQEMSQ